MIAIRITLLGDNKLLHPQLELIVNFNISLTRISFNRVWLFQITMDVPVAIGFTILQLAKLRMLEFYYDMMDKYID